jgi:hypothetical protein
MDTGEDIAAKIGELAEQIKTAKAEKKEMELWEGTLKEMLALKVRQKTAVCAHILSDLISRFVYSCRPSIRS